MQNIPRGSQLKRCLVPSPDHVFVYADYSQIELRIAAHNSQDPAMLAWFQNNLDPHSETARAIFGEVTKEFRQAAKGLNFALIYDAGPYRLSEMLADYGATYTPDEARYLRTRFFETHETYRRHLDSIWAEVQQTGQIMASNGRIRRIPDALLERTIDRRKRIVTELHTALPNHLEFEARTKKIAHAKKQAFNFPVQSVGASITKAALINLHRENFRVVLMVHDSIITEVPKAEAAQAAERIRHIMESSYKLSVPLRVDVKVLNSLDEADVLA